MYYSAGNVGIGTMAPATKLTLLTTPNNYGFEHTDGNIRMGTFLGGSAGGGWIGTRSNHRLSFYVNDGSSSMTVDTNNNVGIGTISPKHRLSLAGGPSWTANGWLGAVELGNGSALGWQANAGGQRFGMGHANTGFYLFRTASDPGTTASPAIYDFTIDDAGRVGIGTVLPATPLEVNGILRSTRLNQSGQYVQLDGGDSTSYRLTAQSIASSEKPLVLQNLSGEATPGVNNTIQFRLGTAAASSVKMLMDKDGNVGIGTTSPQAKLHVVGTVNATAGVVIGNNPGTIDAPIYSDSAASTRVVLYNTATSGLMDLTCKRGDVSSLTIRGGADLAEPFAMSDQGVEPGSVVVIDEEHPGRLKTSTSAYDKRVAGIVSGANGIRPGISMIQEDKLEGGENVALSGRVYVKADTSSGPIKPGDLLTTSSHAGRAMKAADHDQAQGAIIGKAMTRLDEGTGMVLVLVTLQ